MAKLNVDKVVLGLGCLLMAVFMFLAWGQVFHWEAAKWASALAVPEFTRDHLPVLARMPKALTFHIFSGSFGLVIGLIQLWCSSLRRKSPTGNNYLGYLYVALVVMTGSGWYLLPFEFVRLWLSNLTLHKYLGYLYVALVMMLVGSGWYLLPHIFGGYTEGVATVVFGLTLLPFFTLRGVWFACHGQFERHRFDMMRSFALLAANLTIRAILPVLTLCGVPEKTGIGLAFWAGWGLNVAYCEWLIHRRREAKT